MEEQKKCELCEQIKEGSYQEHEDGQARFICDDCQIDCVLELVFGKK